MYSITSVMFGGSILGGGLGESMVASNRSMPTRVRPEQSVRHATRQQQQKQRRVTDADGDSLAVVGTTALGGSAVGGASCTTTSGSTTISGFATDVGSGGARNSASDNDDVVEVVEDGNNPAMNAQLEQQILQPGRPSVAVTSLTLAIPTASTSSVTDQDVEFHFTASRPKMLSSQQTQLPVPCVGSESKANRKPPLMRTTPRRGSVGVISGHSAPMTSSTDIQPTPANLPVAAVGKTRHVTSLNAQTVASTTMIVLPAPATTVDIGAAAAYGRYRTHSDNAIPRWRQLSAKAVGRQNCQDTISPPNDASVSSVAASDGNHTTDDDQLASVSPSDIIRLAGSGPPASLFHSRLLFDGQVNDRPVDVGGRHVADVAAHHRSLLQIQTTAKTTGNQTKAATADSSVAVDQTSSFQDAITRANSCSLRYSRHAAADRTLILVPTASLIDRELAYDDIKHPIFGKTSNFRSTLERRLYFIDNFPCVPPPSPVLT